MPSNCRLGFIGFGHMAKAIFQAFDHARLIPLSNISFTQRDAKSRQENEKRYKIASKPLDKLVHDSTHLILAVRPDQTEQVLKELACLPRRPLISIVAGKDLAFFESHLGNVPTACLMPNIASQVGAGMSSVAYSKNASVEFKSLNNILFSALGEVIEIPESLMKPSMALAGCGPAFVLHMMEAFIAFGVSHGLTLPQATQMSAQTFLGAATLVLQGHNPSDLVTQIAVPGGYTEKGLKVLKKEALSATLQSALSSSAE